MIKARWQGFNVESGENQAPMLVTHWYVLQQGLIFALFAVPLFSGLAVWLSRFLLKPQDRPVYIQGDAPHETTPESPSPSP